MASRTLFSKTCVKSSLVKASAATTEKNLLLNSSRTQAARQATTITTLLDTSTTQGTLPSSSTSTRFHLYDYARNQEDAVHLVKFTSVEGKRLFRNAMVQGHAESFFKLMGNFSTQSSPSHGGVSSLAMVLNALEIDPKRTWKGNWRWFSTEQMQTCSPAESIKERGIPFDEFTCLAQTHCKVKPHRGVSYQHFLKDLELVTSNTTSQMVVNYSRTSLGQHDRLAHFSPIGGYNKKEDQVLIMDVARGKYPSVWVTTKTLYNAMMARSEEELGRSRGYFILSNQDQPQGEKAPESLLAAASAASMKFKCKDCTRSCHSSA